MLSREGMRKYFSSFSESQKGRERVKILAKLREKRQNVKRIMEQNCKKERERQKKEQGNKT